MPEKETKARVKKTKPAINKQGSSRTRPQGTVVRARGERYDLQGLIDKLNEVVVSLDRRGKILFISEVITRFTGADPKNLVGRSFADLVHPGGRQKWQADFEKALTGKHACIDFRCFESNDAVRYLRFSASRQGSGRQVTGLAGILSEISALEVDSETLASKQTRYQDLLENIPVAVYIDEVDEMSTTLYMSPQITPMTGYTPEEWVADPAFWLQTIHPDDRDRANAENQRTNETGDPFRMEYRLNRRDGQTIWVRDESTLLRDENGKPICWRGVIFDITNWKQSEQARFTAEQDLRSREEQYRQMVELSPEAILIVSNGKIIFANPAAIKLLGAHSAEQVISSPILEIIHPDSTDLVSERMRLVMRQKKVLPAAEEKFIRLDGNAIDVEVATMLFPFQGKDALLMLIKEVSERKQAEALQNAVYQIALATESTRSLHDLFPRIHQIISSVMPAENFYITLYDAARQVLTFPYFRDAVDEPYLGELQPGKGLTAFVLRTGKSLLCTQSVHDDLERRGEIKLLGVPSAIWLGVPLIIEGKTIGAMVVQHYTDPNAYSQREQHMLEFVSSQVAIAITRKQAEEALQKSETSYRGLFNSVQEAIYIQDQNGIFLDVNEGASRMYGYTRDELVGKSPTDVSAPGMNDLDALKQKLEEAFHGNPQQFEFWGRRKNGEIFPKDVHVSQGVYYGQDVLIAVAQDITERKRAETDLQRQLKELTILQAVALAGTETILIDDLIERVTNIMADTLGLDHLGVLLYDKQQRSLHPHPSYHGRKIRTTPKTIALGEGVTGYCAESGRPCRIEDTRKDERFIHTMPGMRSELCVPIKAGADLIGVLNAESRQVGFFNEADERLYLVIAGSLATGIEKLRLFEAEHTRRQEAENLRQAVAVVTSSLSLENVLQAILASLRKVVAYDRASVTLEHPATGLLEVAAESDQDKGDERTGRFLEKGEVWELLSKSRKALIIPDAQADPRDKKKGDAGSIHSRMLVPLLVRDRVIGHLTLDSLHTGSYTEENAILAQNFALTAAIAVENARLYESELRRHEETETLRQAAAAVSSSLDLRQVLETILVTLKRAIPYDSASILMIDGDRLRVAVVQGFPDPESVISITFPAKDALIDLTRRSKKPLILADAHRDHRFHRWAGTDYVRGWMCIPLIVRDDVIGFITINNARPGIYNEDSASLAEAFALQVATAIENARMFESEQMRRREEETLREAVSAVASTLKPDQSIRVILEQLEKVVPYTSASVQILHEGALEIVGGRGWPNLDEVIGIRFPIPGENPNTQVIQSRTPLLLSDTTNKFNTFLQDRHRHIKSWMGIPLIAKNSVIGMLTVDSDREDSFNTESARLASIFASQVAAALENSRLYEEAVNAAERRAILHRASQEIARAVMDPEQVYQAVHQAAAHLMPVEAFVISLLDEINEQVQAAYLFDKDGRWPAVRTPVGVGLSGKVIASGEALNIQNIDTLQPTPGIHFGDDQEEVKSILAVPMRLGEKVIGMLSAQSYRPHTYTEDDQVLLEMLAAHSAVAIENARLYNQTRQRLTELEMVNRVSTSLREAQTIPDMLPRLLEETLQALQSEAGAIWIFDPSKQVLKLSAAQSWFTQMSDHPLAPGEGIPGAVFQTGEPIISKDYANDPQTYEPLRLQIPPGWGGACVPIRSLQETIGVLFFAFQSPRLVQPEEVRLVTTICDIAGNAIRRADLYTQTQRQVQRLASLRAIDMAINTILDLRVTLGILLDHILTQLKVDAVDVLLLNTRTQTLQHAASSGFRTDAVTSWLVHIGEDIAGKSIRTRSTIFIPNINEDTISKRLLNLANEHFHSYVCVPLVAKGQMKGVLEVFHRSPLEADADWRSFLETLAGQAAIAIDNSVLFEDLQRSNVDLALAYDATIEGWSRALDLRDRETEGHTQRVTELTLQLAQQISISDPEQVHIRRGALLHDIGKMGVPDNILNKNSSLTDEEWQVMRRHPIFAYEMLFPIAYLRPAIDIPYGHHERWNGTGYPRGLRGEEIPIAARLFTVVDVWDALISDRPYRKAWTKKDAGAFIQENSGIMFDPKIVEIFLTMIKGELD